MLALHPQYITNDAGEKISVIIPLDEFNTLMEELEDIEDVRLYDEAKASPGESIPIEEAFRMLDENRKNKK